MKIKETKNWIFIGDDNWDSIFLDKRQREELKQFLNDNEIVLEGIDIQAFVFCAIDRSAELVSGGKTWIIDSFSIKNNAETRRGIKGVLLGGCYITCTIYDKDTGNKYHGIFLKSLLDGSWSLRLVSKE